MKKYGIAIAELVQNTKCTARSRRHCLYNCCLLMHGTYDTTIRIIRKKSQPNLSPAALLHLWPGGRHRGQVVQCGRPPPEAKLLVRVELGVVRTELLLLLLVEVVLALLYPEGDRVGGGGPDRVGGEALVDALVGGGAGGGEGQGPVRVQDR